MKSRDSARLASLLAFDTLANLERDRRSEGRFGRREGFMKMTRNFLMTGILIVLLSAPLGACATGAATGPATWSHLRKCRLGAHTEAYPRDPRPRHAYGCVSDSVGFIRGAGDSRERMRPL
jgi:hypothetical protein